MVRIVHIILWIKKNDNIIMHSAFIAIHYYVSRISSAHFSASVLLIIASESGVCTIMKDVTTVLSPPCFFILLQTEVSYTSHVNMQYSDSEWSVHNFTDFSVWTYNVLENTSGFPFGSKIDLSQISQDWINPAAHVYPRNEVACKEKTSMLNLFQLSSTSMSEYTWREVYCTRIILIVQ